MNRFHIIGLFILIAFSVSAGCTGILPVQNDPGEQIPATSYPTAYEPQQGDPASQDPGYAQSNSPSAGGLSSIARMNVWAEILDCDGFHNMDGLVVKYCFLDSMNRPVSFDGTSISMQVTVYTPETNRQNQQISPKMLYRGYATITRSIPEGNYPLRGIWIPYSELSLADSDRGIGRIHVRANLPTGVVLEAEEKYIWPAVR